MQFQADILDVTVARPNVVETTALGAAFLAGLAVGFWEDQSVLVFDDNIDRVYEPNMSKTRT